MQNEKSEHFNEKLSKLTIHEILQKLNLNKVMMDFDATSLYPSAMYDENSVYPKKDSGFAFKLHMNHVYVKSFNDQTFNQNSDESDILNIKFYNPPHLIFQHLPVRKGNKHRGKQVAEWLYYRYFS